MNAAHIGQIDHDLDHLDHLDPLVVVMTCRTRAVSHASHAAKHACTSRLIRVPAGEHDLDGANRIE